MKIPTSRTFILSICYLYNFGGRIYLPPFFSNGPAKQRRAGPSCDKPPTNLKVMVGVKASHGNHGRAAGPAEACGSMKASAHQPAAQPRPGRGQRASAGHPTAQPRPDRRRRGDSMTASARNPAAQPRPGRRRRGDSMTASVRHPAAQPRPRRRQLINAGTAGALLDVSAGPAHMTVAQPEQLH